MRGALTVSRRAVLQARALGFRGDVDGRLRGIAHASAATKAGAWNRAYGDLLLIVRDDVVVAVSRTGPVHPGARVPEDCIVCRGAQVLRERRGAGSVTRMCPRALDPTRPPCDECLTEQQIQEARLP